MTAETEEAVARVEGEARSMEAWSKTRHASYAERKRYRSNAADLRTILTALERAERDAAAWRDEADYELNRVRAAEAALAALKAEVVEVVGPFAEKMPDIGEDEADDDAFRDVQPENRRAPIVTVGHFRAARDLLAKLKGEG